MEIRNILQKEHKQLILIGFMFFVDFSCIIYISIIDTSQQYLLKFNVNLSTSKSNIDVCETVRFSETEFVMCQDWIWYCLMKINMFSY